MNKINTLIAIVALSILCSCSGQSTSDMLAERNTADVSSVIDGWNANCATYNFGPAYSDETLGDIYYGSDFETDMNGIEQAIADYYGISRDNVDGTSTMGFVHFDDETVD